ncbi:TPA: L,D-transpeptidase [Legionella pneumophila]|uniref:L,D-transpeptidase n=1 Tax=Legionella pneumophila TaxID=446 RepID=UPI0007708C36|nr:L,D-transpeptidase [Legionella pneumophila]MDW9176505.1 L,D-transpeptidase [Legionella pneumophila]TIG86171.1 L,D-transpeptidase [Legionella pneumophila]CZG64229.1 L%2CD-transpeptidase catalytic domain [Legionella pneumophila]STX82996.1 enhanced entry protein EnhA [Legionella pneumophila]HAT1793659.1 L,D-transpeptidase [Legionella pneumophila]
MEKSNFRLNFLSQIVFFTLGAFLFCNGYAAGNTFIFNPNTLTWKAISSNGKVIRTGRGSGGKHYCSDVRRSCKTPSGVFRVISKGGPGCRSSRYPLGKGGAPMPYCMFFSKLYAIHGSPDVPNYNASHGCVRVKPHDARWLSQNFIKVGTKVIIKSY